MTNYEKMISGKLYISSDSELQAIRKKKDDLLDEFHATKFNDKENQARIIKKVLGSIGKNYVIKKPFFCDYGVNIHIGDNFYANVDVVMLDVNKINIGNDVFLAPRVSLYTATHPIDAEVRNTRLEYGLEINIGNNVWIGGNTVVNPGVTIGNNVIIGSGSVVTKDIEDNVIAAGNPCRVIRKITNEDKLYWQQQQREYYNDL